MHIDESIPIQLVYHAGASDERIVVSFAQGYRGSADFSEQDAFLKASMKEIGIVIPPAKRQDYPECESSSNQRAIFLENASFGKAFYEIYFVEKMSPDLFSWKKI